MDYTLTEYMNDKYNNREDKDNLFGVGVTDAEFRQFIIDYLLGSDWYVVDPLSQAQVNEIALNDILNKYSKRYRTERKLWKKFEMFKERKEGLIFMRAYKCDICGGLYEVYEYGCRQYYLKTKDKDCDGVLQIHAKGSLLDICPDCRKAICDFINERVKD